MKHSLPIENNVKQSISAWRREWEQRIEEGTRDGLRRALEDPAMAGTQATALADMVPKEIHLGRKHCKWSSFTSYGNCVANYGKRKAENGYRNARAKSGQAYSTGVRNTTLFAQIAAAEQVLKARQHAQAELSAAEGDLHDAVDTTAELIRTASVVLAILLAIVLIKSLLYVLALVLFGRQGPSIIQLDGTSTIEGMTPPLIGYGTQEFVLPVDPRFPLITKAALNNQNVQGIYLPWGFTAFLSRLINRKITFNKGGACDPTKTILFSHDRKHFVVWTLDEGEELVFQWKNFFGATENIELRSRFSLRLSTLLLGRVVFHSARAVGGKAYLLLTTQAIGADSATKDAVDAALPERFISWHPHTRFQVQNNLTMFSILNDAYGLVRVKVEGKPSGRVLVESPKSYVIPFSGTFRYIRKLGSPF